MPKNLVIGMQAEACFEEYIKRSKNYKLLIANLQINGENETLGELDYIVRKLNTKQVIHIELACKFYLYDSDAKTSEEEKWIGPNRKDSLYDKLEKIKLQQFPLLFKNETLEKLEELKVEIPTVQELCLKAYLFLPKKMESASLPSNYGACVVGYWLKLQDFVEEENNALYAIPSKQEWLLPQNDIATWESFSEVKKMIETQIQNKKSPLIYKRTPNKMERLFVVWW